MPQSEGTLREIRRPSALDFGFSVDELDDEIRYTEPELEIYKVSISTPAAPSLTYETRLCAKCTSSICFEGPIALKYVLDDSAVETPKGSRAALLLLLMLLLQTRFFRSSRDAEERSVKLRTERFGWRAVLTIRQNESAESLNVFRESSPRGEIEEEGMDGTDGVETLRRARDRWSIKINS